MANDVVGTAPTSLPVHTAYPPWHRHFVTEAIVADAGSHMLVEQERRYVIVDTATGRSLPVVWTTFNGGRPIQSDTMPDGSFLADLDVLPQDGDARFEVCWLYPHETRLHFWRLDAAATRVGSRNVAAVALRDELQRRAGRHPGFLARLLMHDQQSGRLTPGSETLSGVDAAAISASGELALFVLSNPELFASALHAPALETLRDVATVIEEQRPGFANIGGVHARAHRVQGVLRRVAPEPPARLSEDGLFARCRSMMRGPAERLDWTGYRRATTLRYLSGEEASAIRADPAMTFAFTFRLADKPSLDVGLSDRRVDFSPRIYEAIGYLFYLLDRYVAVPDRVDALAAACGAAVGDRLTGVFVTADGASDVPHGFAYGGRRGTPDLAIVPDPYFFSSYGYAIYRGEMERRFIPWETRQAVAFWRGSTTGLGRLDEASITRLQRYRMCVAANALGRLADCGFTGVVQTVSPEQTERIKQKFDAEGLLRNSVPQESMIEYRLLLDADGNANSWGFFNKLLTGSCVIKVDSPNGFYQWYYERLVPWEHYVPVAADLSDLAERISWCFEHDADARVIGEQGRAFALGLTFDHEMRGMASLLTRHARVLL